MANANDRIEIKIALQSQEDKPKLSAKFLTESGKMLSNFIKALAIEAGRSRPWA